MKALEIKNLSYSHKSDWLLKQVQTLFNISFDVEEGEAFGLLGSNGAGKTTTIKCILDLLKNMTGSINIFGQANTSTEARKQIAYIPEQSYFYDNITIRESLSLMAQLSGMSKDASISSQQELLKLIKIEHLANRKLRFLSKGQKQRAMLAQALIAKPKLLILDEPFSGLDPVGRKEFRDIFLNCKKEGTSIILCSHILSDVELICDRVAILNKGKLCGVYEIAKINEHVSKEYELVLRSSFADNSNPAGIISKNQTGPYTAYVFNNYIEAQAALKLASSSGIEIESYKSIHGGLEDLFINLTTN